MGNRGFFYSNIIYFDDINGGKSEIEKNSSIVNGDSTDFITCVFCSGFGYEFRKSDCCYK